MPSLSVSDDLKVVLFCSENSNSSNAKMSQVDESSPSSPSPSPSPQMRRDSDSDSESHAEDARATQVAANQLQPQMPAVGVEEAVDHVAPSSQQQQQQDTWDRGHSRGRTQVSDARMIANLARFSSIASRRGPVARSSSMERTSRLRTSIFPPDMDVDTRRANEEIGMAAGILDSIHNREFNDGDYEMLLALDRGINHGGASGSQINGLPESTVESKQEEACAICLETPTVGDTIRHLPCFHKFHKDCIDPWLGKRTSCPVCKLSIT